MFDPRLIGPILHCLNATGMGDLLAVLCISDSADTQAFGRWRVASSSHCFQPPRRSQRRCARLLECGVGSTKILGPWSESRPHIGSVPTSAFCERGARGLALGHGTARPE